MAAAVQVGRGAPQFVLRLTPDLKAYLKNQADANRRSFNSEVLYRLDLSRRQESKSQGAAA